MKPLICQSFHKIENKRKSKKASSASRMRMMLLHRLLYQSLRTSSFLKKKFRIGLKKLLTMMRPIQYLSRLSSRKGSFANSRKCSKHSRREHSYHQSSPQSNLRLKSMINLKIKPLVKMYK
jgi:hypothetical protein